MVITQNYPLRILLIEMVTTTKYFFKMCSYRNKSRNKRFVRFALPRRDQLTLLLYRLAYILAVVYSITTYASKNITATPVILLVCSFHNYLYFS